jgi:hypothetical protein
MWRGGERGTVNSEAEAGTSTTVDSHQSLTMKRPLFTYQSKERYRTQISWLCGNRVMASCGPSTYAIGKVDNSLKLGVAGDSFPRALYVQWLRMIFIVRTLTADMSCQPAHELLSWSHMLLCSLQVNKCGIRQ